MLEVDALFSLLLTLYCICMGALHYSYNQECMVLIIVDYDQVKLTLDFEDGFLNYIRKCQKKSLSQRSCLQRPLSVIVHPFKKTKKNWIDRRLPLVRRLWRGEDYSSAEHIANVINPTQVTIVATFVCKNL